MQDFVSNPQYVRLLVDCRDNVSGAGVKGTLQQGNGNITSVPSNSVGLIRLDAAGNVITGSFAVMTRADFESQYSPAPTP